MAEDVFIGLGIAIILITFAYILYKAWATRRKSSDFYYDHVIAYKVGLVKDKAEKNKITLVFPPHRDDLIDAIEEEVEGDLNSINLS